MCGAGSTLRPHGRQPKACAAGQPRSIYSLVKPPRRLRALPPGACGDAPFKGLLCDLDGVLYSADQAIPGAVEAIEWMRSQSVPTLFLTNNSTTSRAGIEEKLQDLGFRCEKNQVLTPATVAAQYIQKHHQSSRTALFVAPALESEFEQADGHSGRDGAVSAVVLGDMGCGFNYESMNRAFRLLMSVPEPELIALGKARYFQDHDGLSLDVGPFAQALEFASGRKAHVLGKPAVEFFHIGAELLGEAPEALVMVGDDVRSDVGGAQAAGLRGILVRTGKFKPDDLAQGITPHAVIDSIADLPAWWQDHAMQKAM